MSAPARVVMVSEDELARIVEEAVRRVLAKPGTIVAPAEVLNVAEVAEILGVDDRTVRRWADAGDLPGRRYGKTWRFDRSEVSAWMERQRPAANEPRRGRRSNVRASSG